MLNACVSTDIQHESHMLMTGENHTTIVVTDEVQDFTRITHQVRGFYGIYIKLIKEN